ncbi:MAG: aminotransferase class III-fold pyridoxal phosphate-dependent enzyme [Chitinophagaceae bacterium]|nr:aminotransferase class III-fold pyridoxal phosphate-dependent enzyme [Chitinophagaceae bacterium]
MVFQKSLSDTDILLAKSLKDFIPAEVFDIHVHPYNASHFPKNEWAFLSGFDRLGCKEHRERLQCYMPVKQLHGLYFGMPRYSADRDAMNKWVAQEAWQNGTTISRSLMVVSPDDDPVKVAEQLRNGLFCGIKVYHCYAGRKDTMNAALIEYAPEWMWELLNEVEGVLMLHLVKNEAIDDAGNQREIKRLCKAYPKMKLILAHIARSFNYRNARNGLYSVADVENVVVDTSAICETESFKAALKILGPQRVLWGSDFGVSEMRGRCITTGDRFFWLHPELIDAKYQSSTESNMTLVGIESLLALKESCEDSGLDSADIGDIFLNNALRLLQPHLPLSEHVSLIDNKRLWGAAREVISGGTGLLSKRAEQFSADWPVFFSRSAGCEVWDLNGRKYIDCAGGIGAVLLGYGDEEVTKAVTRRLALGTYSSLVNPQELELADKLLELHPWAGKVRYARTGGEAMSVAVRIARAASGKSGVAFCGYHGWHDWYLAANLGETNALDGHLLPGLQPKGVPRELAGTAVPFRYNDWTSFQAAIDKLGDNCGVVVMEPMRSQFPENDFLQSIRNFCSGRNIVMVVDEITSGLRYGYPGALSRYNIIPDVVVYAKAMGNGIPFAAIVGKNDVMMAADDSFISSSYWTDGIGTAAALAVLEKMEKENVFESVWKKGIDLQNKLKEIAGKYPLCKLTIGGMPSSPTFTFTSSHAVAAKQLFNSKMQEEGILVSGIFYLMHKHEPQHLQLFIERFEKTLQYIEKSIQAGLIQEDNEKGFQHGFTRLA